MGGLGSPNIRPCTPADFETRDSDPARAAFPTGRADTPWSWPMGGGLRLQAFGSTDENFGNIQK